MFIVDGNLAFTLQNILQNDLANFANNLPKQAPTCTLLSNQMRSLRHRVTGLLRVSASKSLALDPVHLIAFQQPLAGLGFHTTS